MFKRRRVKQTKTLRERLLEQAQRLREEAKLLPDGAVRDAVLERVRQSEAAAHMDDWLNSPGLRPPRNDDISGRAGADYAEQAQRLRDKAAEAEQLIDQAQTEQRRESLTAIAENYHRTADQLEGLDPKVQKPR